MRKTTMQDIADELGISRVTVWKVMTMREGVSDYTRKAVIMKAIQLKYRIPDDVKEMFDNISDKSVEYLTQQMQLEENSDKTEKNKTETPVSSHASVYMQSQDNKPTVSVTVSRPETSVFWMSIIHEIAKEASLLGINLMYTYLPSDIGPDYVLPSVLTNGTVQGMIVLNVYSEELLSMLSALPVPKVFMDTVTKFPYRKLNGDLILIEGRSGIGEIVDHLAEKGKKRFGFIGDIEYAQTNYERYYGFLHSLEKNNLPLIKECCLTGSIGANTYYEEIHSFIDSLKTLPEVFVCVSDFVASIVYKDLTARGLAVPEDILISGFDGNPEYFGLFDLTTVQVHNEELGLRLMQQLFYRIRHPNACNEIIYLCCEVIFRHSTDC
ncbi:MAG: LacI family DNA-binding transcriptional regulator [Lachnospiraceae bacterium]|nr:LacI family DNA-binding transcriptional regulator [Lachnospiraceae bacterium]